MRKITNLLSSWDIIFHFMCSTISSHLHCRATMCVNWVPNETIIKLYHQICKVSILQLVGIIWYHCSILPRSDPGRRLLITWDVYTSQLRCFPVCNIGFQMLQSMPIFNPYVNICTLPITAALSSIKNIKNISSTKKVQTKKQTAQ